jgi:hypothetical protein
MKVYFLILPGGISSSHDNIDVRITKSESKSQAVLAAGLLEL